MEEGQPYEQLKKCIVISIMDFCLLKETNKYHSIFMIKEIEEDYRLNDDLELHYLELPKLMEKEDVSNSDDLEKWLLFLKNAGEKGKDGIVQKLRGRKRGD